MKLLNLKDQRDIVKVIEYLIEIHQKNNTVADVMERFGLTYEQYQMCCNLAVPALAQGNMKGRFTMMRKFCRKMRRDIRALYETMGDDDGPGAEGIRMLYGKYCDHRQDVVYGKDIGGAEDDGNGRR